MEDEKISDSSNDKLEGTVNMLIEMRKQARDNKTLHYLTKLEIN
jgi:cysteinyl-tRNA synthetase